MSGAAVSANPLLVPSDTAVEVRERVREAAASGTPLRIVGGGTWLDAGRPVREDAERLDIGAHAGIVEYEPGDLTLTAKAGTPLRDVQAIAARERQWLALDPWAWDGATLGATIATASYGPLAHAFGTPRDNVLGLEFVDGTGRVARGGGRVVKNVAGFDLTRLHTGAWGTLGVVTEVTMRLRPRPARDETMVIAAPSDAAGLARFLAGVRAAPIAPLSLELVDERTARAAGVATQAVLVARLAGNAELVVAQIQALAGLGDARVDEIPHAARGLIGFSAAAGHGPPTVELRLSRRPSRLAATWADAAALARRLGRATVQASVGRGVVRLTSTADEATIRDACAGLPRGADAPHVVYERLPTALWRELAPSAVGDRLSRGIRDAFDPHRLLNPGILGE